MRQGRSSEPSPSWKRALVRLRYEVAALRFEMKLARLVRLMRKFDPSQPRVPAGQPGGGQWTSGGPGIAFGPQTPPEGQGDEGQGGLGGSQLTVIPAALVDRHSEVMRDPTGEAPWKSYVDTLRPDGSIAKRWMINRDGSTLLTEINTPGNSDGWDRRDTVTLANGKAVIFETSGGTQTIKDGQGHVIAQSVWTTDGPRAQAVRQTVFLQTLPAILAEVAEAGIIVYDAVVLGKSLAPLIALPVGNEFTAPERPGGFPLWVGGVTRERLYETCPRAQEVQERTDNAVDQVRRLGPMSPAEFGNKVHKTLELAINGLDDPNFVAEISLLKSKEEVKYGDLDSIRIDVYERVNFELACAYDIKTGNARLWLPRQAEIAFNIASRFPSVKRIIISEVRPSR